MPQNSYPWEVAGGLMPRDPISPVWWMRELMLLDRSPTWLPQRLAGL